MRSRKALRNTITALGYEFVALICGLILPRLILTNFGSSYNGITSSIIQFLNCIALLRAGVAGVTRAALYKPLAENDTTQINAIVNATQNFMKRIAFIFVASLLVFACVYPFLVDEFDWYFSFSLVLILGISSFAQYYFGITYQLLLEADQNQWVFSMVRILTAIMNVIIAAILIKAGAGIHLVKLGSALAFSINPIFINIYANKHYKLNKSVEPDNTSIKQRWDAFGHSVAAFVNNNTDIMVLTVFANIKEVSVYTVYNFVIANLKMLIETFSSSFGVAFGNMLANNEKKTIQDNLKLFELILFGICSVVYTTAITMIVPFAKLYTHGVVDVEYARPIFATIITIASCFACYRIPYQAIIESAGHFKQTRNGAFAEAIMNITISIVMVIKFGLVGVAVGTLVATVFRTCQYAIYLSKHIVHRPISIFAGHVVLNAIIMTMVCMFGKSVLVFNDNTVLLWIEKTVIIFICTTVVSFLLHFLFYRNDMILLYKKIRNTCSRS